MLIYTLGDEAMTVEVEEDGRVIFAFTDEPPGTCRQVADDFFNGAAVNDARELLECSRRLQFAASDALRDAGWRKPR